MSYLGNIWANSLAQKWWKMGVNVYRSVSANAVPSLPSTFVCICVSQTSWLIGSSGSSAKFRFHSITEVAQNGMYISSSTSTYCSNDYACKLRKTLGSNALHEFGRAASWWPVWTAIPIRVYRLWFYTNCCTEGSALLNFLLGNMSTTNVLEKRSSTIHGGRLCVNINEIVHSFILYLIFHHSIWINLYMFQLKDEALFCCVCLCLIPMSFDNTFLLKHFLFSPIIFFICD